MQCRCITSLVSMLRAAFSVQTLVDLIRDRSVITVVEIQELLGPVSAVTAKRKLAAAGCRSSYSHNCRYYTLDELADYDAYGLWSYQGIRFSRNGRLAATLVDLADQASADLFACDLKEIVKIEVFLALNQLVRSGRLSRVRVEDRYLYCSSIKAIRRCQRRHRAHPPPATNETFEQAR